MLDKVTIRSAHFEELAAYPEIARERNSAIAIVGTGAFVAPISLIQEFAEMPGTPRELEEFVEVLQAAAVEAARANKPKPTR